jgi:hypothetical protein
MQKYLPPIEQENSISENPSLEIICFLAFKIPQLFYPIYYQTCNSLGSLE